MIAPLTAAVLASIAMIVGWHGVDFPAALYRVGLFHRHGFTLWDSQWYSGHWTLSYSVIFPPVAGVLGLELTAVLSAALAALAFDRLVIDHFGSSARAGSALFAAGTLVQVAIGQLPFLLGESLALGAFWAATRQRPRLGVALGLGAVLASPLAGAFLMLAAGSRAVASRPHRRVGLVLLAIVPAVVIAGMGVVFPDQGVMPFPVTSFLGLCAMSTLVLVLVPRHERGVRLGVTLYLTAVVASFVLRTPVGGNISRLGQVLAAPLAACLVWPRRRFLLGALAIPLGVMQWTPAVSAFASARQDASANPGYFTPLLGFLDAHREPLGRVEIVPLRGHWEAAYAAPTIPLARGWQRQLDTANNPQFYDSGALQPARYRAWLLDNGVRFVALADVALDYAGQPEAGLIDAGVDGLRLVWAAAHWRVFEVEGSAGIVEGPARLVGVDGEDVALTITGAGPVLVRVRFSVRWAVVSGHASLSATPEGWTQVDSCGPGELRLQMQVRPADQDDCDSAAASPVPGAR